jgi:16S rRNA (guanine966-N2)-methyltransferase
MTRVIAGSRRGRRLRVPNGAATRPTTDRVREALFSAITAWAGSASKRPEVSLRGLALADLFAGSGAVGIEAASRGADPVLLVEAARRTAAVASHNIADLDLTGVVTVRTGRVDRVLADRPAQPYDLIFLDPPYELPAAQLGALLADLVANGWVDDGLVVVERSRRDAELAWPRPLQEGWRRDYGETTLIFGSASDADRDLPTTSPGGGG